MTSPRFPSVDSDGKLRTKHLPSHAHTPSEVGSGNFEGVKVHDGTTGGGTRPTGYVRVRWIGGTARPTNMVAGDIWEHDA